MDANMSDTGVYYNTDIYHDTNICRSLANNHNIYLYNYNYNYKVDTFYFPLLLKPYIIGISNLIYTCHISDIIQGLIYIRNLTINYTIIRIWVSVVWI